MVFDGLNRHTAAFGTVYRMPLCRNCRPDRQCGLPLPDDVYVDHQFQKFWIVIKINPELLNLQTLPDLREN